jgi:uncharacterized membrane protein
MLALRYVALMALVTWLGGLVAIGVVAAPAVFDVTAARHAPDARLLAGAIVGDMLRRFEPISWAAGAVLLLTLIARAVLGPRPRRLAWRAALATLMLATSVYAGLVVRTHIERLQREIGAAPSSLAADDPRRIEFGRLHGLANGLQLVPLLGGLALMYWELKE